MQSTLHIGLTSLGASLKTRDRKLLGCDQRTMTNSAAKTSIVGLGDPIVDVLVRVSAGNFDQLGLQRGGSTSLRQCDMDSLLERVDDDGKRAK